MELNAHLARLKEILEDEEFYTHKQEVANIQSAAKQARTALTEASDEEEETETAEEVAPETVTEEAPEEEGVLAVAEVEIVELPEELIELESLVATYFERFKAHTEKIREQEKDNLEAKRKILDEFRDLIQNEENLGRAFERIKKIREDWKTIGEVPRKEYEQVQNEYSKLSETFNYNINIYKELKEHDLKRNFSLKNQVVHQVSELANIKDIRTVERELNRLRNEWDEIGGTYKDKWEIIKEKYWAAVRAAYDRINLHYQDLRKVHGENLETKKGLLEKLKTVAAETPESNKDWKRMTDAILAIQADWKAAGFSPRKDTQPIWEEFRAICNTFFDGKKAYFSQKKEVDNVNRDKKRALIDKVNELKTSKDWRNTSKQIIQIQKDWKKVGHAGPHAEHKLWKEFRGACDEFFNARDNHHKELESVFDENLAKRKAFIADIPNKPFPSTAEEALEVLSQWSSEYAGLGDIPNNKTKGLAQEYQQAVQAHINTLDIPDSDKKNLVFRGKIAAMKGANPAALQEEKRRLQNDVRKLEEEINRSENNLAFFSVSKGSEGFLADAKSKIDQQKLQVDRLKERIKIINVASRS